MSDEVMDSKEWHQFISRLRLSSSEHQKDFHAARSALIALPAIATNVAENDQLVLDSLRSVLTAIVVSADRHPRTASSGLNIRPAGQLQKAYTILSKQELQAPSRGDCAVLAIRKALFYLANSGRHFETWHESMVWVSNATNHEDFSLTRPTKRAFANFMNETNFIQENERNPRVRVPFELHRLPLAPTRQPDLTIQHYLEMFENLLDDKNWVFWRRWFKGFIDGKPLSWELQRNVGLIDNIEWKRGYKNIANIIEGIEADFLSNRLPQAEEISFNETTAKFSTNPIAVERKNLLGATLSQVEDALEDAMASPSNGLHSRSREVRVIKRIFIKYGNDPQQIEMGFVSAHAGLTRQIHVEELPASEENMALLQALEEGALGIRATHQDVAENRKILSQQRFAEMSDDQKGILSDALPILKAISDEALNDDWQHDIPALVNTSIGPLPTGAPTLPSADEATRVFSRAAKISLAMKAGNVVRQIDNSAGYKAVRIVTTVGAVVTLGLALLALI
ncbi:MAG: hypothetical protein WA790_14190 [Sulfitobacter sp.]